MRNTKKIATLALAGLMTFSMAAPVMAAEHTITINDSTSGTVTATEHTFKAYQVFTGNIASSGAAAQSVGEVTKLADIEWGTGVNSTALLTALKASTVTTSIKKDNVDQTIAQIFADCSTAEDVANAMTKFTAAADIQALCKIIEANVSDTCYTNGGTKQITVPTEGYYFIKDATESLPDQSDAYSDYILQILDNKTITVKTDAPKETKKILDGDKAVDESSAQIGEVVTYEWSSTVPNTTNYEGFYYFYMEDSMDGLKFDSSSVKVWIDVDNDGLKETDELLTAGTDYVVTDVKVTDGTAATKDSAQVNAKSSFTVSFLNMLEKGSAKDADKNFIYVGKTIYVDYSATLDEYCTIGETGNPNTVKLNYSNKPSYDYTGTKTDKGLPDSTKIESGVVGTTPEDINLTYTAEVDLTKYADEAKAGENKELAGAEFTLTGTAYQTVVVAGTSFKEDASGTYYKLKDGTYTTQAPTTTDTMTMVAAADDATKGYVVRTADDTTGDKQTDVKIGDVTYRVVNAGETPAYILQYEKANSSYYESTTQKYSLVTGGTTETKEAYSVSQTFTTGSDGKIYFKGLDAGTYKLVETKVPEGYNKCDDIYFTIKFNGQVEIADTTSEVSAKDQKCEFTITDATGATFSEELGRFATNIIDKSGATLPTTGGMGTTIFYIVGSILVVGAGVVLVAKKRMAQ